tara:strand:+ start:9477 stop:10973 length:1497 start_codon:yes stop_codon:yes gene_type:complete
MAKQSIGIGSSANDGTGDTLRDGAVKLNSNFTEIYQALGDGTNVQVDIGSGILDNQVLKWNASNTQFEGANYDTLTSDLDVGGNYIVSSSAGDVVIKPDSTGDIKFWAGGSGQAYAVCDGADGFFKWNAPYTDEASLPSASTYHGMFAHAHDTGKGYFSHNAAWIPLISENSSISLLSDVDTTVSGGPSDGQVLKWNASNTKWEPANDETTAGGGGGSTQNLFETINADTGTTTASAATDTLIFAGGTNISTSITGDTVTIAMTGTLGDPDQNLFSTIGSDAGNKTAASATSTINFIGGTSISTAVSGDNLTITNDAPNIVQNVLQTATADTGSYTAAASDSTLTVTGGTNISTSISGSTLTINNTASALPNVTEGQSIVATAANTLNAFASPVLSYVTTNNAAGSYRLTGPGVNSSTDNPTLYLYRGFTYRFNNSGPGTNHPFELRVGSGGAALTDGVSGSTSGVIVYTVPMTVAAGTTYVYQCTIHGAMVGNLVIV